MDKLRRQEFFFVSFLCLVVIPIGFLFGITVNDSLRLMAGFVIYFLVYYGIIVRLPFRDSDEERLIDFGVSIGLTGGMILGELAWYWYPAREACHQLLIRFGVV